MLCWGPGATHPHLWSLESCTCNPTVVLTLCPLVSKMDFQYLERQSLLPPFCCRWLLHFPLKHGTIAPCPPTLQRAAEEVFESKFVFQFGEEGMGGGTRHPMGSEMCIWASGLLPIAQPWLRRKTLDSVLLKVLRSTKLTILESAVIVTKKG